MLCFGAPKPQYVLLLIGVAEKQIKKKLESNSGPSACGPRALPSELLGSVNWAAHTSKARTKIDHNFYLKAKIKKSKRIKHFVSIQPPKIIT